MNKVLTMTAAVAMACATTVAQAYEEGDWILRVGATTVSPETDSDNIYLPTGLVAEADVDDDTQLGIIPAYMVTDYFGIEVLAATPFKHNIEAKGKGAIQGTNLDAGSTKQLPPTVSLQLYPRGGLSGWQPYVGVGLNYTNFFDEDVDNQLIGLLGSLTGGAVNGADLELDDSWGLAVQAGVDVPINDHWAFNAGVWYIDIDTTAKITAKADGATAAEVKFDVDIDPWVYNIGIAYKF
ncbi:MAG: outer membrane beta-barrel protein [Halioglobus sp.]|nr:outer membrane beta-barrel protein [Halioglobus sp.]